MNIKTANQKQQKQALIASTALKMFAETNFYDISINSIAAASGVAKGTVFNYFKTKENIFMHLLLVGYQDFFTQTISQFNENKIIDLNGLKDFLLSNTEDLIDNHLTLIKLNALRGPILEGKASMEETIQGRKDLYQIHERLATDIHNSFAEISVAMANKIFIVQSSIVSGLINLSDLDSFNQQPINNDLSDFTVSIKDDALTTFDFYLTGLFLKLKES